MQIPIVNEQDEIIGHKDRYDRIPGDVIRTTATWITDENGNILLAQRKLTKKENPGKWGPAVGGTVEEGETYESNAYKETEEEIGIRDVLLTPYRKFYGQTKIGHRFCQVFTGQISRTATLIPQEDEVEELQWVTKEEFKKMLEENPENFIPILHDLKNFLW